MRGLIFSALFLAVPSAYAAQPPQPPAPVVDPYDEAQGQLKHKDALVRRKGIETLGQLRRKDAVPALLPLLSDPLPFVRSAAADALGVLHANDAVKPLTEMLATDKDAGARQSAAAALAYI